VYPEVSETAMPTRPWIDRKSPEDPWANADCRTSALAIVARGDQIETVTPKEFRVRSQSRPGVVYRVAVTRGKWSCECPWVEYGRQGYWRKGDCIHIIAARIRCGFQEAAQRPEVGATCDRCHSSDVKHAGVRKNRSGPVQRYACRACGFWFSGREGYHKRRADPDMIAKALDLYFRGVSFRQIAEHFLQAYALKVSPMTVYRWVTHFGRLTAEWMDRQGATVGQKWNVDETVVSVDGDKRWVWNVMDAETRFLLATHVSKNRSMANTRAPFEKAKRATDVRPTEVRSDGMPAYPEAIKREFGRYRRPGDDPKRYGAGCRSMWTPHRVVPSIRAPDSNNLVERLNGSEKDRIRPMRGFDTMTGTSDLMEGYRAHYNLVRTHLALGRTPGEVAGLGEIAGFRWRTIIDLALRR
jgi:putative transposase